MLKNKEKIYSISAIIIMLDQMIKLLIRSKMALTSEITIIPNFFSFYYVENTGAAFSILTNKTLLLVLIAIACLVLLDRYITKLLKISKLEIISYGLVIGGIVGNLIDRLLYESVIDYLSFTIFNYNFPVFNLSEIYITYRIFLLLYYYIKEELFTKKVEKTK